MPLAADETISRPGRAAPLLLVHLALAWVLLAAVDLLLATSLAGTAWQTDPLPTIVRETLLFWELRGLTAAVAVIGFPLVLMSELLPARWTSSRAARAGLAIAVVIFALVYAASWASFHSTGRFLDLDGVRFVFDVNVLQFFQHVAHMEPWVVVGLPPLAIAAGLAALWGIKRGAAMLGARQQHIVESIVGVLILGVFAGSLFGKVILPDDPRQISDPEAGKIYTLADLFVTARDDRTGPFLLLWRDAWRRRYETSEDLALDARFEVERRPQIDLDSYVRDVDTERQKSWNVILVLIESLRADQLRAGGSRRIVMPAVEALASEGRIFIHNYSQASHSNFADIAPLSSHYPLRSERAERYPENPTYPRVLIYDVLKAVGYDTAIISSQNETWGGMINYLQTDGLDLLFHSESFTGPTYVPRGDTGFADFIKGTKRSGKIDDRFTVAEAIQWIDERAGRPFFIYMNLQNSHVPYDTPTDFPRRFGPEEVSFSIRFNQFPKEKAGVVKDLYANSLAYVDFQLGKLIDHLRETGQWDRTMMIVSGDTGQAFFEHGFAGHANQLYDELVRVPLVIRAPGLSPGIDSRPSQHIDVPPTILDLLGLPPHPSFQGISLVAPDPRPDRSIYLVAQCPLAHQFALVRRPYKYIYDVRRGAGRLLNLEEDPGEFHDVAALHPDVVKDLDAQLDTWRRLQLDYYRDLGEHRRSYPPVMHEPPAS